jgi:hypothetical protein
MKEGLKVLGTLSLLGLPGCALTLKEPPRAIEAPAPIIKNENKITRKANGAIGFEVPKTNLSQKRGQKKESVTPDHSCQGNSVERGVFMGIANFDFQKTQSSIIRARRMCFNAIYLEVTDSTLLEVDQMGLIKNQRIGYTDQQMASIKNLAQNQGIQLFIWMQQGPGSSRLHATNRTIQKINKGSFRSQLLNDFNKKPKRFGDFVFLNPYDTNNVKIEMALAQKIVSYGLPIILDDNQFYLRAYAESSPEFVEGCKKTRSKECLEDILRTRIDNWSNLIKKTDVKVFGFAGFPNGDSQYNNFGVKSSSVLAQINKNGLIANWMPMVYDPRNTHNNALELAKQEVIDSQISSGIKGGVRIVPVFLARDRNRNTNGNVAFFDFNLINGSQKQTPRPRNKGLTSNKLKN